MVMLRNLYLLLLTTFGQLFKGWNLSLFKKGCYLVRCELVGALLINPTCSGSHTESDFGKNQVLFSRPGNIPISIRYFQLIAKMKRGKYRMQYWYFLVMPPQPGSVPNPWGPPEEFSHPLENTPTTWQAHPPHGGPWVGESIYV